MVENRIREFRDVRAGDLLVNPDNFRKHPTGQRDAMAGVLEEIGNIDVLKCVERDGKLMLLDGHLRRELMADDVVKVAILDLTDEEARRALLTFDRLTALAELDVEDLTGLMDAVAIEDARVATMIQEWREEVITLPEEQPPPKPAPIPTEVEKLTELGETWRFGRHRILVGDVLERLRSLDDKSVQCVVTSPPYWGLRDYGTAEWSGGDEDCEHVKVEAPPPGRQGNAFGTPPGEYNKRSEFYRDVCADCGARRIDAQLGLEATPEEHVERMVEVFREIRRVLRDDGTAWMNYGDTYAAGTDWTRAEGARAKGDRDGVTKDRTPQKLKKNAGLKPKDLVGMPWRVALALQTDGWYLRSDIIWAKPNPMPESCSDRPTKSHEHLFLLTKSARYFYDADAVREGSTGERKDYMGSARVWEGQVNEPRSGRLVGEQRTDSDTRNLRDVWTIPTQPMPEAHFATFPERLVDPCLKAGTSECGRCSQCGAPWTREVDVGEIEADDPAKAKAKAREMGQDSRTVRDQGWTGEAGYARDAHKPRTTTGWRPSCDHTDDPVPCVVLDPFAGAGTVAIVAERLGQAAVLVELSPPYADIAIRRWENLVGEEAEKVDVHQIAATS